MQTYRDLIYMVLDELKLYSDDSSFTEDHILFLIIKYRALLLKQKYSDIRKTVSESNYQRLYVDTEEVDSIPEIPLANGEVYLKTTKTIPHFINIGLKRVYADSYYKGEITYITKDRMKYVSYNKYLKNIVYCSLNPDNHIYFKFIDKNFLKAGHINIYGVFLDCAEASYLEKDVNCELLDRVFPLEDSLISPLIELTVKELNASIYRPKDTINNGNDDLSNITVKNK